jgi:hypothetical protein
MISVFFKVLLLIAVAVSQLFWGVSCCCFVKPQLDNPSARVYKSGAAGSGDQLRASAQTSGSCPKCCAKVTKQVSSASCSKPATTISTDGDCRCAKVCLGAMTLAEPLLPKRTIAGWSIPVSDTSLPSDPVVRLQARFEVPVRFGRRTWYAIACIWRN